MVGMKLEPLDYASPRSSERETGNWISSALVLMFLILFVPFALILAECLLEYFFGP